MPAWFVGEVSNITVRHLILETGDHIQIKRASLLRKKNYKIQYSLLFQLKRGDKARREPELLVRTSKTTYKGLIHAFDNFEPAALFRQLVYSINE